MTKAKIIFYELMDEYVRQFPQKAEDIAYLVVLRYFSQQIGVIGFEYKQYIRRSYSHF